jgi:hypothetical protein
MKSKF